MTDSTSLLDTLLQEIEAAIGNALPLLASVTRDQHIAVGASAPVNHKVHAQVDRLQTALFDVSQVLAERSAAKRIGFLGRMAAKAGR